MPWIAGLLVVTTVVALWAPWRNTIGVSEPPSMRLNLDLGPDVSLASFTGASVILSPDGTRLVLVSQAKDGIRRLFTRGLDQPKAIPIAGTEGAYAPFFSPDGQWVAFFAQGKLKKTRIDGGEPLSLCDAPAARGGSWGEDGNIIAALDQQNELSQIYAEGGKTRAFTQLNREVGETTHRWPQVLPGGKNVLFIASNAYGNYENANIDVVSVGDHQRKTVLKHAGMYARLLPNGYLIYATKGALFAAPFNLKQLEVRGAAIRFAEVANNPNLGFAEMDFSRNGTLVYRTSGGEDLRALQWVDRAGKAVPLAIEPARYAFLRLSPDGTRLTYVLNQESSQDLWTYDIERGIRTRLTNGQSTSYPVWSVDGRFIVFQAFGGMFWTRADGSGQSQPLTKSKNIQLPNSFTPDGARLAYSEFAPGEGGEIRVVPMEGSSSQLRAGEPQLFVKTAVGTTQANFGPGGRWLAYTNGEGGRYEVYVRAFPDTGTQVQVSNAGGIQPMWSANGHELFYRTEDQRIMVVKYTVKGNSFVAEKPRIWFGKQLSNMGMGGNYDLAPDGKRMIAVMPVETSGPRETQNHVMLVTNFFEEVRRRVGVQGK